MSESSSGGSIDPGAWTPPDVEALQALLPGYAIDRLLGQGGMGAVYRAKQTSLGRAVAIKVLPETLVSSGEGGAHQYVERFRREARAMAGLDHPAIISVYDFGQTGAGHLYIVMEYVDGMDIEQYIAACGGRVDPEHAVAIVSHLLDALGYAHSKGIVHRDIKPANVLINRAGRVKVADFGLVKELGGEVAAMSGLTLTDMAMGTPNYMAPEALEEGGLVDHRADLYAVGVMLYKMLTGKLPRGLFRLPSETDADIDTRFDLLISKSMAARVGQRFQSAAEFREQLDDLISRPVTRVEPGQATEAVSRVASVSRLNFPREAGSTSAEMPTVTTGARRFRTSWAWIAALIVALIGGGYWFFEQRREPLAETEGIDLEAMLAAEDTDEPAAGAGMEDSTDADDVDEPPGVSTSGPVATEDPADPPKLVPLQEMHDGLVYESWQGRLVAIQSLDAGADAAVMSALVADLDEFLQQMLTLTGIHPAGDGNPRLIMRASNEVPHVRDFGEIDEDGVLPLSPAQIEQLIDSHARSGTLHWQTLWASTRNVFQRYQGRLTLRGSGGTYQWIHDGVRRFLPLFVANQHGLSTAPDAGGLIDQGRQEFADYLAMEDDSLARMIDERRANGVLTPVSVDRMVMGLMAQLAERHGGEEFLRRFYVEELPSLGVTRGDQDAFGNLVIAASRAADEDLSGWFAGELRWTVSDKARSMSRNPSLFTVRYKDSSGTQREAVLGPVDFVDDAPEEMAPVPSSKPGTMDRGRAIGVPDFDTDQDQRGYFNMGRNGSAVWSFDDNALYDGPGDDLLVCEIGGNPEPCRVEVSVDGVNWIPIGTTLGGRSSVDIAGVGPAGADYRFVRLTDVKGQNGRWPGADVDAIAALNSRVLAE